MKNRTVISIALIGALLTAFIIYRGSRSPQTSNEVATYPSSPYEHYIAGEGLIESIDKNILIGASFQEIITDIYVAVGDTVSAGTPLFKTDTRQLEAQLAEAKQAIAVAQKEYEKAEIILGFYKELSDANAVSKQAYTDAEFAVKTAQENLNKAHAATQRVATDIERATARAPIDGKILQVNIRVGQRASEPVTNNLPLILMGNTMHYHLRVDINEEEAWRYQPGSEAMAFVRGNYKLSIPLTYAYLEPYLVPKQSLTGRDTELVDTRVLQAVYAFSNTDLPVYAGQLVDVYIKADVRETS